MFASASLIRKDTALAIKAPKRMQVAQAVEQSMRVPVGGGHSVKWDSSITPYLIEPLNCLNSREYDAVIFVGPARTGKTIALIDGWIVYSIICDPSDFLLVQLTQEKASEHSRKRLDRTFRVSPDVADKLSPRSNDNNIHDKVFRAGNFLKIGWPSINILSSSDYKYVALTDYDRWPEDVDGEGDGFSLASKRTTTFMSAGKTLVESSPGRDVLNLKQKLSAHEAPTTTGILSLYNQGDRRRLYWQCPFCLGWVQPIMDNMVGFRNSTDIVDASECAALQCNHCQELIKQEHKRELNINSVWLKEGQAIDKDGVITGIGRRSRIASFWMEGPAAAYQTWAQLTYKLLAAEQEYELTGSEDTLRAVINTDWGRPYLSKASLEQRKSSELMERAEDVEKRTVPNGCRFLIASVDVQGGKDKRFVVQIIGYGDNGERWVIDRYNIKFSIRADQYGECHPIDPAGHPEDWDMLTTDVLDKKYRLVTADNAYMPILAMALDSGGEDGVTDNAYKYWRRCRQNGLAKKVYLIKGDSTKKQKIITVSYPDNISRSSKRSLAKGDVPIHLIQTDALKDRIHSALSRSEPGANYIHFPNWLGEWFYDELVYEERGADGKWRKPGKGRNEAFDLFCYAHAVVIAKGYERINWEQESTIPQWAKSQNINSNIITEEESHQEVQPPKIETAKQEIKKNPTWMVKQKKGWL